MVFGYISSLIVFFPKISTLNGFHWTKFGVAIYSPSTVSECISINDILVFDMKLSFLFLSCIERQTVNYFS